MEMKQKIIDILNKKLIACFGGLDYESPEIEGIAECSEELVKLYSLQSQLINAQEDYIKFVGKELNRHESMITVRPYMAPDTITIRQGIERRNKIALLKAKIKNHS